MNQIQQKKETCDRTIRSLKEAEKLTKEQTARKIAELEPLLIPILEKNALIWVS